MKPKQGTDSVIAELVNASCGRNMSAREKHLFRESLRNLVRLAQSELIVEMRGNVCRLTGLVAPSGRRARMTAHETRPMQQGFEFNHD